MKRTSISLVVVLLSILVLIGIGALIYIYFIPQAITPSQCEMTDDGFVYNSYICPSSASNCVSYVTLNCNEPALEPLVVFRASEQASFPNQLAIDNNNDGNLERWRYTTRQSSQAICSDGRIPQIGTGFFGTSIKYYNSDLLVCTSSDHAVYSSSGATIPTSTSPTEPYASTGREIYAGNQNIYYCTAKTTGDKEVNLFYSGSQPGSTTEEISLNPGQRINYDGRIDYDEVYLRNSECTKNMADPQDKSIYYFCNADSFGCGVLDTSNPQYCTPGFIYNEDEQKCQPPFTLDLKLTKNLFSIGESVTGVAEIKDTSDRAYKEIQISLLDSLGNEVSFVLRSTNSQGIATFSLPGQTLSGDYKVKAVVLNHPLGVLEKEVPCVISIPIFVSLNPEPDQIQYTSNLITAIAMITDSDGNPENVASWDLSGTKCGTVSKDGDVQISRIQTGKYRLETPVSQECLFTYKVSAIDESGFKSEPDLINIQVKKANVIIQADLSSVQDSDAGRYTITFKTLDVNLQPVVTSNSIRITDSDGCVSGEYCNIDDSFIPNVVVSGNNGFYSFSHDFKEGLNTIEITSSRPGVDTSTQEYIVNLFPGSGGGGGGGGGDFPIATIITAVVVILGLGIFFWIVFKRK